MKEIIENPDNDKILGQMLALEIQEAREKKFPSAEKILEELQ